MLPDTLKDNEVARAVEEFDAAALVGGKLDRAEVTLEIAADRIVDICRFLKDRQQFVRLSTVTAIDRYPAEPRFEVVYHLHSIARNLRLRLKARVSGADPQIDSVTGVWRGANWYERETFDLFGIRFRNHPGLTRIMLPAEFEGYPLRKDFPVTGVRE